MLEGNPAGYRCGAPEVTTAWRSLEFEYKELDNQHTLDDLIKFLKLKPGTSWENAIGEFRRRYGDIQGVWVCGKKKDAVEYYGRFGDPYKVKYDSKNVVIDLGPDGMFVLKPRENPRRRTMEKTGNPYADTVIYYINEATNTAVPTWSVETSNGWYTVHVGKHAGKARYVDKLAVTFELLKAHYPGHTKKQSFFVDTSYHSPLNQRELGKIAKYGMSEYTVGFSTVKTAKKYTLKYPVESSAKSTFGKKKTTVTSYIWRYIVLNWKPSGKGREWFVTDTIHQPDGSDKVLYKSATFSDPEKAKILFSERVEKAKTESSNPNERKRGKPSLKNPRNNRPSKKTSGGLSLGLVVGISFIIYAIVKGREE